MPEQRRTGDSCIDLFIGAFTFLSYVSSSLQPPEGHPIFGTFYTIRGGRTFRKEDTVIHVYILPKYAVVKVRIIVGEGYLLDCTKHHR
jgi:hypothetical protein